MYLPVQAITSEPIRLLERHNPNETPVAQIFPAPPDAINGEEEPGGSGSSDVNVEKIRNMGDIAAPVGDLVGDLNESVSLGRDHEGNGTHIKGINTLSPALKCECFDIKPTQDFIAERKHEVSEPTDCADCLGDHVKQHDETVIGFSASPGVKPSKHCRFTCDYCEFSCFKSHVMKNHYWLNHHIKLLYVCEPCFFVSEDKYTYESHWKSNHVGDHELPPIAIECLDVVIDDKPTDLGLADSVSEYDELVVHNETNHNNYLLSKSDYLNVKCKFCTFETDRHSRMKSHIASLHYTSVSETLVNTADDTRTYRCVTCATISVSKQAAADHFVSQHCSFPVLRCELCETDIKIKSSFYKHLNSEMHREYYRRSLRCPYCQFATLSTKALQKHTAATHGITKKKTSQPKSKTGKFPCDKCKYVADRNGDLNAHKKRVHGFEKGRDGFYSCEECDFKSTNKDKLAYHTRSAPDHSAAKNSVCCEICDFPASNLAGLRYHKFIRHGTPKVN